MPLTKSLPYLLAPAMLLVASVCVANEAEIAATVKKSLPYLQSEGVAWIEKRGCVSCHQIPFMVWSLSAAKNAGFDVDAAQLDQWREWSTQVVNFVAPDQKENVDHAKTMAGNIDTMAALLLAVDDGPNSQWRASFSKALADNQQDDGSWKSCGQLPGQKRPIEETNGVTAAWTMLALASQGYDDFDADGGMKVVDASASAQSTEWWVARLLLADRLNHDRKSEIRTALIDRQNDDGGWGWITDQPSDALATGMAIYALQVTADETNRDDAVARATKFLVDTQQDDGSWQVPGTKKSTQKKVTPTSSYWGTAWAVIGLLQAGFDAP